MRHTQCHKPYHMSEEGNSNNILFYTTCNSKLGFQNLFGNVFFTHSNAGNHQARFMFTSIRIQIFLLVFCGTVDAFSS